MPKSFKNLQTDLRDLGLGVLGEHFLSGTVKSCLSTAPAVGNYLRELGYTVANYGGGREYYNHYDLSVKTIDQGWVSVDPTYMQFHVQHQIDEDDAPITLLDPLMAHFDAITKNGLAAFEIIPLKNERTPSKYEAPQSHLSPDGTWKSYWAWRAEYAAKALAAAEGLARMRRIPSYAASLVAWRLRKTKKNPGMPWLPLETLEDYLPDMRSQGVSEVARSPRGFVTAYQKAKGDPEKLSEAWHKKRANFIKRHMAQVKKRKEPLFVKGAPSRRHLALIAWAYSPTPSKL